MATYKLHTFVSTEGKTKGKELVSVIVPGLGWKGINPYTIRTILEQSQELAKLVAHTDEQLIAMAHAQELQSAKSELAQNAANMGVNNTTSDEKIAAIVAQAVAAAMANFQLPA